MIAEVSAVLSTLNAVNGAINTLRETKSNVDSVSRIFSKVSTAAEKIAEVEEKAKQGKIELSTNEAMQIAMAKKQMIDYEKRLKDLFLISGNHETYNHMKKLQRDSVARARKRAAKAKAKKKARKAEIKEAALVLFIGIGILILLAGGFTLWYILR